MEKLLTTKEVADILRLRVETVTRKAEMGLLPAIKIDGRWRVPEERLIRWLKDKEQSSPAARKAKLEKPLKLKTYRMGQIYGSLSRKDIYRVSDG